MYPWLLNWSPIFHFPFSGAVEQDISPNTHWFFKDIPSRAGNGALEEKIFMNASYGTQLGLLTDVLLSLVDNQAIDAERAEASKSKLVELHTEINQVKEAFTQEQEDELFQKLLQLKQHNPEKMQQLLTQLEATPISEKNETKLPYAVINQG